MQKTNFNLLILGMTGSGKSQFNRRLLRLAPRAIVLDRQYEYGDEAPPFTRFRSFADFYVQNPRADWRIVYQGEKEIEFVAVLDLIYEMQRRMDLPPVAVFLDEASLYSSSHTIDDVIDKLYTKGRHGRISVVTSTQRITQINPIIRDNSHLWVTFRLRTFPADVRERFPASDLDVIPNLQDLTPQVVPTYGVHYLTDQGDLDVLGRFRDTLTA